MPINLDEVNLLENAEISKGDKFLYSADANDPDLKRVEREIPDLEKIANAGGKIAFVFHEGRFGDTQPGEYKKDVANFIRENSKLKVIPFPCDFPGNNIRAAYDFINDIRPGTIAVMGNARDDAREESKDKQERLKLAKQLAAIVGKEGKVAIGGFGKAHRENASNCDIIDFLPGYLTNSQYIEMDQLREWAGRDDTTISLAVLGGVKKEKITIGYAGFSQNYDNIIPGGILLNTALKAQGYDVGSSWIAEDGKPESKNYEKEYREIAKNSRAKLHLPTQVTIARKTKEGLVDETTINIRDGVPKDFMIVSYTMPQSAIDALEDTVARKGRMVVAGTPDLASLGFGYATIEVASRLRNPNIRGILLGGDSCCEIDYQGQTSSGGGSALYYISNGTTPVFEKLKEQKRGIK